jgi:hypothetical protein
MQLTDSAQYIAHIKNACNLSFASSNDYTIPYSGNFSYNIFIFLEHNRISLFQSYASYMIP